MESGIEMSKAKSFDFMVAFLTSIGTARRDCIPSQADMTEFTETVLLKGYPVSKGRKFYAKNLEPVTFR